LIGGWVQQSVVTVQEFLNVDLTENYFFLCIFLGLKYQTVRKNSVVKSIFWKSASNTTTNKKL
jgi:hypothetical protein